MTCTFIQATLMVESVFAQKQKLKYFESGTSFFGHGHWNWFNCNFTLLFPACAIQLNLGFVYISAVQNDVNYSGLDWWIRNIKFIAPSWHHVFFDALSGTCPNFMCKVLFLKNCIAVISLKWHIHLWDPKATKVFVTVLHCSIKMTTLACIFGPYISGPFACVWEHVKECWVEESFCSVLECLPAPKKRCHTNFGTQNCPSIGYIRCSQISRERRVTCVPSQAVRKNGDCKSIQLQIAYFNIISERGEKKRDDVSQITHIVREIIGK